MTSYLGFRQVSSVTYQLADGVPPAVRALPFLPLFLPCGTQGWPHASLVGDLLEEERKEAKKGGKEGNRDQSLEKRVTKRGGREVGT